MRMMRDKLEFFLAEKMKVHIFLEDRRFLNGVIISKKSDTIYIIEEFKLGETYVFLEDIFSITEFKEAGK